MITNLNANRYLDLSFYYPCRKAHTFIKFCSVVLFDSSFSFTRFITDLKSSLTPPPHSEFAKPPSPMPFFTHACPTECSLSPVWPRADGPVQDGITPVKHSGMSNRTGHAKHSHAILAYGNNVCQDHTG